MSTTATAATQDEELSLDDRVHAAMRRLGLGVDEEEEPFILGFNELLFEEAEGHFWGTIQFWGYCMIIVSILQLLKALSVDN